MECLKSNQEVDALIAALAAEIARLPAYSVFQESNASSKAELQKYHRALLRHKRGHKVRCKKVEEWLAGCEFSELNDCLS